jgi:hypothetical protein
VNFSCIYAVRRAFVFLSSRPLSDRLSDSLSMSAAAGLFVLLLTNLAGAGVLTSDANALPGWSGSIIMSGTNATNVLEAQVDYAVYTKANYLSSPALNSYLGHTPANPGSAGPNDFYVYAYQIFNNPAGGLNGNVGVRELSIGLDWAQGALPTNSDSVGHDNGSPSVGAAPAFSQIIPLGPAVPDESFKWIFTGGGFAPGANSDILIFVSPSAPKLMRASMVGANSTNDPSLTPRLPSPTPEPGTLTLAILAVIGLAAKLWWKPFRATQHG